MYRALPNALQPRWVVIALAALFAAMTVLTTATPAAAADFNAADGPELEAAVAAANANAEADTITLTGAAYALTAELPITSDITIVGDGTETITAAAGERVIDVTAGDLTISGVALTGGLADEAGTDGRGGAIRVDGDSTADVSDSVIAANSAVQAGGGIEVATGGTLTVTDTDFLVNIATGPPGNGGAIHSTGTVAVTGGTTQNNAAVEGGGFWNGGTGAFDVDGVTFDSNDASGAMASQGGGALYNENASTLGVTGSTFTGNSASGAAGSGGAILNNAEGGAAATLNVDGSSFTGNTSNRAGGAIENAGASATITDSDFDGNNAGAAPGNGGAIHNGGGDVAVTDGTTQNNLAVEGGAFWNAGGTFDVDGVTFDSNDASGDDATQGGGAIYNEGSGALGVVGSTFTGNTASGTSGSGGAIINIDADSTVDVATSRFTGNTSQRAGGAIEVAGNSATVTDSDFDGNDAGPNPGNGGAIHNGGGDVAVSGGSASNNQATEGGAFWNSATTFDVDGVTFSGNSADGAAADEGGGALYNQMAGTLTVSGSTFTGNDATGAAGSGGAILNNNADSVLTVAGSSFIGNTSQRAGGAIENAGSSTTVTGSGFDGNDAGAAPGNGGAIHNGGGDVSVTGGITQNNTAVEGGAFWNAGGTFDVNTVRFVANSAGGEGNDDGFQGGGAIYNENAGTMNVTDSAFTSNTATAGAGSGGAILNINLVDQEGDSTLDVNGSTFVRNSANRAGGAIENAGAVTTVNDSEFDGNDVAEGAAPGNGGAIHDGGGNVTVTGGTADGNSAVEGGAFWTSGTMTVTGTTLEDNVAEAGGAFYIEEGGTLLLDGVEATSNTASAGDGNTLFDNGGTDTATDTTLTSADDAEGLTCNELVGDNGGNVDDDGSCFNLDVIVDRVQGNDRIQTAIAASQAGFGDGEADAVVLTRADIYPDALAGTPLAVQENAPLLLTGQDGLDSSVDTEIRRVLDSDGTIYLLGGTAALNEDVQSDVEALGFDVVRYGGVNRFDTAVVIATDGLDDPSQNLLADGEGFADAVSAGAAAGANDGAVLLTNDDVLPPETAAYLDSNTDTNFAIGGPAAAAVPDATPVVGPNRVATSVLVAQTFFDSPPIAGIATEGAFPDALAGGVLVANNGGPLLLSSRDTLNEVVRDYLVDNSDSLDRVILFGGINALSQEVENAVRASFPTMAP